MDENAYKSPLTNDGGSSSVGRSASLASRIGTRLSLSIATAILFWVPSIALHALLGTEFGTLSIAAITLISPLAATIVAFAHARWLYSARSALFAALSLVLGIWIAGPFMMSVSASFTGGGFAQEGSLLFVVVATLVFPLATLILSVSDGSILALLLSTFMVPCIMLLNRAG